MISTREDFLAAVRRADLTPQGITIGPVAFVQGKNINLGKVIDEATRRALINKIKLAPSKYFVPGVIWGLPCSEETSSSNQSGMSTTQDDPPF